MNKITKDIYCKFAHVNGTASVIALALLPLSIIVLIIEMTRCITSLSHFNTSTICVIALTSVFTTTLVYLTAVIAKCCKDRINMLLDIAEEARNRLENDELNIED